MIKNFLIAAALVIASPALVFSQDLFVSFSATGNQDTTTGDVGTSGTATIYVDQPFGFHALDLNISSSDSSVLLLTGGEGFNGGNDFSFFAPFPFNSNNFTLDAGVANLFPIAISGVTGIIPAQAPGSTEFVRAAGSGNGAIRLGEVTFDIVGAGVSELNLSLGAQGAFYLPDIVLNPSLGSATLTGTADIPEPSSATLLVLGAVGMVARRRRARA